MSSGPSPRPRFPGPRDSGDPVPNADPWLNNLHDQIVTNYKPKEFCKIIWLRIFLSSLTLVIMFLLTEFDLVSII